MKIKNQFKALKLCLGLTLALMVSVQSFAQSTPVTLKFDNAKLEQVMTAIEQQTSYLFVFDKGVDTDREVSISVANKPLSGVLSQLFSSNTNYAVENTSIVLSSKPSAAVARDGKITGKVVDAAGEPVIGASVVVEGTTVGASTDVDGTFSMTVPAPVAERNLVVSYIGYDNTVVPVGVTTNFDITIAESTVAVDQVVVTALGIKRSEKALAYNVQKVDSDEIVTNKDANFINSLNGKVAGVNINTSSSGVGGASKVVMRGTKSIAQSSNALYVIDGIPMYSSSIKESNEFSSQGSSEAIADINPEDIESMTVLTGAAAAALYGSQAANGAIVINTKKGQEGKTTVTVSSNTEMMNPFVLPSFQNRYGTGDVAGTGDISQSWGNPMSAANAPGYNPRDDYFQTGIVGMESVSLSTGTEHNQTYFSAGAVNSRGIVPNNGYDRYNFTFRNTASFLQDKMVFDFGASYIKQGDQNMTNQGIYSNPLTAAYLFPRGSDWEDIKMFERYDPSRKINTQYWPLMGKGGIEWDNPYWTNYRNLRENNKNRYMFNAGLSYQITDYLSVAGRLRIDNFTNEYTEKFYATTNPVIAEGSSNGLYGIAETKGSQTYGDALINYNRTFCDFSIQANVGASFSDLRETMISNRGPIREDGLPNVFNVLQLDDLKTKREQSRWAEQTQSVFASAELGYKNTYFLTLTARNDWPSQLAGPKSNQSSFFYPSVGASVVLSEAFNNMPKEISYMKLRGSYASVGMPFPRFIANPTYSWDPEKKIWQTSSAYPMYNLKPERTNSWEIGLTMRFLKHFNLDVSYYNTKTFNQTFDPGLSVSSGYSTIYVQTGSVKNSGVELALGYNNKWGKFGWSSNFTLSTNKNEIMEVLDNYKHPETGEIITMNRLDIGGLQNARFILKPGGSLGDLYSILDFERDDNGDIYINESGAITRQSKSEDLLLGSVLPDANMSWRNDFTAGQFNFGFMVTARLGGIVYSATQARMDYAGVTPATADARDAGGVMINGGDLIPAYNWYSVASADNGLPQHYTYSATNVRLQEASIGYTIPREKLGDVLDITVSLVGRNLFMFYNKAPFDPEAVATTGNYYQGIDYFMMPSTRNIGFNVRLKF